MGNRAKWACRGFCRLTFSFCRSLAQQYWYTFSNAVGRIVGRFYIFIDISICRLLKKFGIGMEVCFSINQTTREYNIYKNQEQHPFSFLSKFYLLFWPDDWSMCILRLIEKQDFPPCPQSITICLLHFRYAPTYYWIYTYSLKWRELLDEKSV